MSANVQKPKSALICIFREESNQGGTKQTRLQGVPTSELASKWDFGVKN